MVEFADNENMIFEDIMRNLQGYSYIQKYEIQKVPQLLLRGLEIHPDQRKAYCNGKEIYLTAKEYSLLCLLVVNKGRVLTYEQIYEKVWGDVPSGGETNIIGFHICNLREKLYVALPDASFNIKCIRKVGYCFEVG